MPETRAPTQPATEPSVELRGDWADPPVVANPAVDAPRPEIRFKRRVNYATAAREIWEARELIRTLAERDLRARYKQAALGFAWAIVPPVLLMVVFSLVFTRFAKIDSHGAPYVLFSYLGLIPWTFFASGVALGGMSLLANMPILNKVYCPREVFPLATIAVAGVDAVISLGVLAVLFGATGTVPKVQAVYAPILLAVAVVFTLGVTFLISSLVVYIRDLRLALPLILQLGLFATPVAYGIEIFAKSERSLLLYSAVNPLAPVIDGLRRSVLLGQAPRWSAVGVGAASACLLLAFSYSLFKRLETGIADIA
jgi:ABC-type polysaccharide/polyol phosphate export permease